MKLLRELCLLLLSFFIYTATFAQEVIWASKVLEKSSEFIDTRFPASPKHRAVQILGPPSVLPQTVSSACSWRPLGIAHGEDYIKVGFDVPTKVRQIIVGETVGPGAVGRIFGYTVSGKEVLLYENGGDNVRKRAGLWNELIPQTEEEIVAVKLLIVHSLNKGSKEYDCIGISASSEPFTASINVAKDLPANLERVNLGTVVNSKFSEVAPLVSPDGKNLYFTRWDHPKNYKGKQDKAAVKTASLDVWVSRLGNSGNWEAPKNMSKPIHEGARNAVATIAMDGKSVYALNVRKPNGDYEPGLTKVTLKNDKWEDRKKVEIAGFEAEKYFNYSDNEYKLETEFSISSDEKYLVMGLVRKETYGDKDLYVSFKTGDNAYSKPINLGPVINTAGNEGSPFLAADNKTLYFNSNGHPGYGDMDIFMTTRLDDTWKNWSVPVNLGPQINSPEFDGYISIPASGEFAYFSSAKKSLGLDDLFKVKLFPSIRPEAVVMYEFKFEDDQSASELIPDITFINEDKPNDPALAVRFIYDDESKSYKTVLPTGYKYKLSGKKEGYEVYEENIDLKNATAYEEVKKVFKMVSLKKEMPKPDLVARNEEVKTVEVKPETPKAEVPKKEAPKQEKQVPRVVRPNTVAQVTPKKDEVPKQAVKEMPKVDDIPLEMGKALVLQEVYFDQSKADIREESYVQLEKIKKIMIENPSMEILLEGHTDNQGDADLNFKLAQDRISNVKNYLTKDGQISADRISIKSWGQYRPLMKNSTEEAMMKNRRVEFTIIKM